jgi:hypothetical protein
MLLFYLPVIIFEAMLESSSLTRRSSPKVLEPIRAELPARNRMLNVFVP